MTKRRSTEEVDGVSDHAEIQGSLGGHRPEEQLSLPVFNLREGVGALLPAARRGGGLEQVGRGAGVLPQEEFREILQDGGGVQSNKLSPVRGVQLVYGYIKELLGNISLIKVFFAEEKVPIWISFVD
jgi:hypothetical protein